MARKKKKAAASETGTQVALKRGRLGPAEVQQVKEMATAGATPADIASKLSRSVAVIEKTLSGKPSVAPKAKGKPGRPKGTKNAPQSATGHANGNGVNLRQIISDVVREEVQRQLQAAFK